MDNSAYAAYAGGSPSPRLARQAGSRTLRQPQTMSRAAYGRAVASRVGSHPSKACVPRARPEGCSAGACWAGARYEVDGGTSTRMPELQRAARLRRAQGRRG